MNADLFERLNEKSVGDTLKQTGGEIVDRAKQFGSDFKNEGAGTAFKNAGKDAANYALNGGLAGHVAHNATEDSTGIVGQAIHNFTGIQRETAGEFAGAILGRAAIAGAVALGPQLLKAIPGLTQNGLGGIIQKVFDLLGLTDKNMDINQIKMKLQQAELGADTSLQFDVRNLQQKAKMSKSDYAQKVLTQVTPVANQKLNVKK